ncbi:hypothetical protein [Horticoccus sp. 23ND18S-11]|uniref:hypothetical protein n=1 Tax=Horticoccus sp. 23ND18S-11 TaxID=3391832 RepID=UPI0039C984FD
MKPFSQGRRSLPLEPLRPPAQFASAFAARHEHVRAVAPGSGSAPAAASAQVEVVKEGDKIVRLIVSCVCGERVEIECLYPAGH